MSKESKKSRLAVFTDEELETLQEALQQKYANDHEDLSGEESDDPLYLEIEMELQHRQQ